MLRLARYNIYSLITGRFIGPIIIEIMGKGAKKSNCMEALQQGGFNEEFFLADFDGYVKP